jgi:hypothetical protein
VFPGLNLSEEKATARNGNINSCIIDGLGEGKERRETSGGIYSLVAA